MSLPKTSNRGNLRRRERYLLYDGFVSRFVLILCIKKYFSLQSFRVSKRHRSFWMELVKFPQIMNRNLPFFAFLCLSLLYFNQLSSFRFYLLTEICFLLVVAVVFSLSELTILIRFLFELQFKIDPDFLCMIFMNEVDWYMKFTLDFETI